MDTVESLEQELEKINNQIEELNGRKHIIYQKLREVHKEKSLKDFRNTVSFIKTGKKLDD